MKVSRSLVKAFVCFVCSFGLVSVAFADIDDDQNAKIKDLEGKVSKYNAKSLNSAVRDLKKRIRNLEKKSPAPVSVVSVSTGPSMSNEQIARVKVLDEKMAGVNKALSGINKAIAAGLDKGLVASKKKELLAQAASIKAEKAAVISGEEKASDAPDVPSVDINFEYDFALSYDDHGFDKTDDNTPTKTAELGLIGADFYFNGTIKQVSYSIDLDLTGENAGISGAMVSRGFGKMFTLSGGLGWANEGGFDNKNLENISPYTVDHLVFPMGPVVQLGSDFGKGGTLTLQLMNDVVKDEDAGMLYYNEAQKQPALIVEWMGSYGFISPLFQYVPYDGMNHSNQMVVGFGLDLGLFSGTFDYVIDNRVFEVGDEAKTTTYTSVCANMSFSIGNWAPHLKFATMDVKQPDTDAEGNTDASTMDDNGQNTSVGVTYTGYGDEFAPYFSIDGASAKVIDGDSTETKSGQVIVLGFAGMI